MTRNSSSRRSRRELTECKSIALRLRSLLNMRNRFRWAFCQLDVLRYCLPPSVRRTLDELPESLDETYERVLKEIKKPNRDHARRVLQCLVVAIRPLDVEELAEVFAVDFDDAEGIPKLKTNWRWEDEEQALLTSCSSLITIIETEDSRIVQFSHFSVKEYLTSARLATSIGDVSRFHIVLEPVHTILAQACIGVLLQPEDDAEENGIRKMSPLARYAAQHWVTHAQLEGVSLSLRKSMEYLFDVDKPYLSAWVQLYDIDTGPDKKTSSLSRFAVRTKSDATPLYYATLCGFEDLVEHLVVKYPQHVDSNGGYYVTPLVAALAGRHFQTARLLHHDGTDINVRGNYGDTPLSSAARYGDLEMVQVLLDYKANVDARDYGGWAPIHAVSIGLDFILHNIPQSPADVTQLLLEHDADVNTLNNNGRTPLQIAAANGTIDVVRVLLEHGANVGAQDSEGITALHLAAYCRALIMRNKGDVDIVRVLLEHGANVGAQDSEGRTALHIAADSRSPLMGDRAGFDIARVLLEHGANVGAQDSEGSTALHLAADSRSPSVGYRAGVDIIRVLLEHGANVGAQDSEGRTALHLAADSRSPLMGDRGVVDIVRVLLEHGANVGAQDSEGRTALHLAADSGSLSMWDRGCADIVRVLLEHGANVGVKDNQGRTAFQLASANGNDEIMELLSEYPAKAVVVV